MMRLAGVFLAVLAYGILVTPGIATGEDKPKVTVNEAEIYLGNSRDFVKPGEVDVDAVYRRTPEYREILEERNRLLVEEVAGETDASRLKSTSMIVLT